MQLDLVKNDQRPRVAWAAPAEADQGLLRGAIPLCLSATDRPIEVALEISAPHAL